MWSLMHYDEVMDLDESMLLENPKVTSDKQYKDCNVSALCGTVCTDT